MGGRKIIKYVGNYFKFNYKIDHKTPKIMKKLLLLLMAIVLIVLQANAQVGINTDNSAPDPSAGLDVKSYNQGVLIPRMTRAQRNAITSPAEGLMVYCTNCGTYGSLSIFTGGRWLTFSPCTIPAPTTGTHVTSTGQVIWHWNAVPGAAGYKWNTVNDYATAIDNATDTVYTEAGLACGTNYLRYVWAYNGCGYSSAVSLAGSTALCPCSQPIADPRDGKSYNIVLIGSQCWMAQNLNIGTRINISQNPANNSVFEKYCYNNTESNCDTYGGLYQWDEAMQYVTAQGVQGICPAGWHLPTDAEWTTLKNYLGDPGIVGGMMKEAGLTHWAPPNTGATNSSGFTALPGGYSFGTSFNSLTNNTYIWSSTEYSSSAAWNLLLSNNSSVAYHDSNNKSVGFSVRCIMN